MVVPVRKDYQLGLRRITMKVQADVRTRLKPPGPRMVLSGLLLRPVKIIYILSQADGLHLLSPPDSNHPEKPTSRISILKSRNALMALHRTSLCRFMPSCLPHFPYRGLDNHVKRDQHQNHRHRTGEEHIRILL
jgi:hypothetical protein